MNTPNIVIMRNILELQQADRFRSLQHDIVAPSVGIVPGEIASEDRMVFERGRWRQYPPETPNYSNESEQEDSFFEGGEDGGDVGTTGNSSKDFHQGADPSRTTQRNQDQPLSSNKSPRRQPYQEQDYQPTTATLQVPNVVQSEEEDFAAVDHRASGHQMSFAPNQQQPDNNNFNCAYEPPSSDKQAAAFTTNNNNNNNNKRMFNVSNSNSQKRYQGSSMEPESAIAEITNVSVEISPKIIIAGEMPKEGTDPLNMSPLSEEEMAGQTQQIPNNSPKKTHLRRHQIKNNEGFAQNDLEINTSELSGMMNSQKIDAYEKILMQKQRSDPRRQLSDMDKITDQIHQRQHTTVVDVKSKFQSLKHQEKGLFGDSDEGALNIPNAQLSYPITNDSQDDQVYMPKEQEFQDEEDTAFDDMNQSQDHKQNPVTMFAKHQSINIPQNSPKRQIFKPNQRSEGPLRYSAGGIYKSNQPMNIASKNNQYFNIKQHTSQPRGYSNEDEDCQSVSSQDEKQLNKINDDGEEDQQMQAQDEHNPSPHDQMLQYQQHNSSMIRQRQTEKQSSLINNVNVIDLRALSPGMRHLQGNQSHQQSQYRKPLDAVKNEYFPPSSGGRKSPINESGGTGVVRYQVSKTNDSSLNAGNISQDMLQEHLEVKKFQLQRQRQQQHHNNNNNSEKRYSPMFKRQQIHLKKGISPIASRVNFAQTQNIADGSRSPKHQDSPQDHNSHIVVPPNTSQQKRHSMQTAIKQNNKQFKNYKGNNRMSNVSGCNNTVSPFNHKPQKVYNRNISDGGGDGTHLNQSPVLKSVELKSAQIKKMDTASSKNFFGSFFYNQQSIGPGSIVSGSGSTPPPYDGFSPKIDDNANPHNQSHHNKRHPPTTAANSTASNSSYNKFKNFLYNTVKTAQVNYHSKICMNLKDKTFFHHSKDKDTKTMLLHNKYVNKRNCHVQELENLNQRFTIDWRGITWFSYRDQIERPIGSKSLSQSHGLKSDHGWGCMLRTGQMILFQSLIRHFMNDMSYVDIFQDPKCIQKYFDLLMLFMDNSPPHDTENVTCPFGIHSISQEAKENLNMDPGQWYGPQMISIVLRNICNTKRPINQFRIHVCLDGCIFLDEIEHQLNLNNSVLVLIPLRLGMDNIEKTYLKQVKYLFQLHQSVGIMGGKDHMAIYLVGDEDIHKNNSGLFYLDPHYVQNSVPRPELEKHLGGAGGRHGATQARFHLSPQYLDTYHTYDLRTLDPNNMQTSLAPGFYIRDHDSFKKWVRQLNEMQTHFRDQCIFTIYNEKPQWMKDLDSQGSSEGEGKARAEEEQAEAEQQDLGPMRVKSSPSNPKAMKKQRSFDDSFEDLKDYDQETIGGGDRGSPQQAAYQQQKRQRLQIIKQKTAMAGRLGPVGMQAQVSSVGSQQDPPGGPGIRSNSFRQFQFVNQGKPQSFKIQNYSEAMSSHSKTIEPNNNNITDFQQNTPTDSSNMALGQGSFYNKEIVSSTLSRDSTHKDQADIDNEMIDIGDAQILPEVVQGSASNNNISMGSSKMPRPIQSQTVFAQQQQQQSQITKITKMEKKQQSHRNTPERQLSSARASQRRQNPNANLPSAQQFMKSSTNDSSVSKGHLKRTQQMSQGVIGPRTMMGLNQGKALSKIGHMQDTGMVNPKNRHSRTKGLVQQRTVGAFPGSKLMSPGASSQQNNVDFGSQLKSKSDVKLDLKSQISGSMASNQSPSNYQTNQTNLNQYNMLSKTLDNNGKGTLMSTSKSFPDIRVNSSEDPNEVKNSDSMILGNIDENVAEPENIQTGQSESKDDKIHESEVLVSFVQQDQQMVKGGNMASSSDNLRIHDISAYGTKLKQRLLNFKKKNRQGSNTSQTSKQKSKPQASFDQDVGVQQVQRKTTQEEEEEQFEKI